MKSFYAFTFLCGTLLTFVAANRYGSTASRIHHHASTTGARIQTVAAPVVLDAGKAANEYLRESLFKPNDCLAYIRSLFLTGDPKAVESLEEAIQRNPALAKEALFQIGLGVLGGEGGAAALGPWVSFEKAQALEWFLDQPSDATTEALTGNMLNLITSYDPQKSEPNETLFPLYARLYAKWNPASNAKSTSIVRGLIKLTHEQLQSISHSNTNPALQEMLDFTAYLNSPPHAAEPVVAAKILAGPNALEFLRAIQEFGSKEQENRVFEAALLLEPSKMKSLCSQALRAASWTQFEQHVDQMQKTLKPEDLQAFDMRRIANESVAAIKPTELLSWVNKLPPGILVEKLQTEIARAWTENDSNAASMWINGLPSGSGKDEAILAMISSIPDDLASARVWAETIGNPTTRALALSKIDLQQK